MVKNLPSNAGDQDSNPGQGAKIPHAVGQLTPCTPAREAHMQPLEKPLCAAAKTQRRQKKKGGGQLGFIPWPLFGLWAVWLSAQRISRAWVWDTSGFEILAPSVY